MSGSFRLTRSPHALAAAWVAALSVFGCNCQKKSPPGTPPKPTVGTVTLTATSPIPADGATRSLLDAKVLDTSGQPFAGATVTFASSRKAADAITQPAAATGKDGVARGAMTSTTAGNAVVTVTVNGAVQPASAAVKFTAPTPPVIKSFTANPATVGAGAQSTLSWDATGAASLAIDNGVGDVTSKGLTASVAVTPAQTTTYTLTATNVAGSVTAQASVTVVQATPHFVVSGLPATSVAGQDVSFTVTAADPSGATMTGYAGTVHFTSDDAQALLPGDYTFTAGDAGVHGFTAKLETAGDRSLTATDAADPTVNGTGGPVRVTAAAAQAFSFLGLPASTGAGASIGFTLAAVDAYGNVDASYAGTAHVTSTDGAATLPADYTFAPADAGQASLRVTLRTAGAQTLSAVDAANSAMAGTSPPVAVAPGPAVGFTLTGLPAAAQPGAALSFTLAAHDAYGNLAPGYAGTVHFTSSDGAATLPPDYAFTPADAGARQFGVTFTTVGSQTITATDTANSALTVTSAPVNVSASAVASLAVTGLPASAQAGQALSFTVAAKDGFGNTVTDYVGTVHFTSDDPTAQLPADYTFTLSDTGARTFTLSFHGVGSFSVNAADTAQPSVAGADGPVAVSAGAATRLVISGLPAAAVAGTSVPFTVTAGDAFGNVATGYAGTVVLGSSDAQATVTPASYTFTVGDAGAHAFSAVFRTAGNQTVAANDAANGLTATSAPVAVTNGAAASYALSGVPAGATAGVAFSLTLTVSDAFGNVARDYTGTAGFASSDSAATLPAPYAFTAGDAGTHAFTAVLYTAGSQSFSATDTTNAGLTASASLTVTAGAARSFTVSNIASPIAAGAPGDVKVVARDAFANVVTGYLGKVHFTSTDPAATLPPDYQFVAGDAGAHLFPGGVTFATVGTQSVTADDVADPTVSGAQSNIDVVAGSSLRLVVSNIPSPLQAGSFADVKVQAQDNFGNVVTSYTGKIHFTSSDPRAMLPADYQFTSGDAGTHLFSAGVVLETAGTQGVTATDTANVAITGTQGGIAVTPGPAQTLAVTGFPSPTTAGAAGTATVTARDAYGNVATGYTGTVKVTSSDAQATLPANHVFTAGDAGVFGFTVALGTVGAQSITATDTANAAITGTQVGIQVKAGAAASLALTGLPATATAGQALGYTITARDAYGNVATGYTGTVKTTATGGGAVANYTFTAGDAGAHAFSITFTAAGTQTVTVTDTVNAALTASGSTAVAAGAAQTLAVAGFPSPVAAGASGSVTVTAKDAFGNVAAGYTGTIHFTSTDPAAVLPADYGFVAGDAGAHTFAGVVLETAGTRALTATDTAAPTITGTQGGITVNAGAAASMTLTGLSSTALAGTPSSYTVTLEDAYGNVATGYTGTVKTTSTDGKATLPAAYTFTPGDAGTHGFSVTFGTVGAQSVTAADTVNAALTATGSATVGAGPAATLAVSGVANPTNVNASNDVTVRALDAYGNTATGYAGTVHFTSNTAATLPPDYAFTGGDQGVHTFLGGVVFTATSGAASVTATDTVTASITGAQAGIVVNPATTTCLTVSGVPSPQTAGSVSSVTVAVTDCAGNPKTSYTGTVHFTSSDAQAVLPADFTFPGGASSHTFTNGVTLKTAGTQSVKATDTVTSSINGSQTGIVVSPAAAASFAVSGFPSPQTAGVAGTFTVTARDAFGNVATGYTGTVHFTSSDGAAALPGNATLTSGAGTFSATLKTAGAQSLTATDTVTASITGAQTGIQVNAATAASLAVSGFPSPQTAGVAGTFTVTARDAFGNVATAYGGTVTFTSSDAQAALPANSTLTAGTKSFSATLKTAGVQSLTATDTVTPSITGAQTGIQVNAAAAASLTVAGFPSPQTAGVAGAFTVTARDAFGNVATSYAGTVSFSSTDPGATLPASSTLTAGTKAFSATFVAAGAQTLTGSDGTLTGQQTGIQVVAAAAKTFVVAGFPSPVTAGVAGAFTVTARDAFGNVATGYTGTAAFSSSDAQAALPANYAFTAGDAGTHAFSATLETAGTQSLTATDTVTTSITGTQGAIAVNSAAAQSLVVTGFPSPQTAGVAGSFTVTARDAFGNTATSYAGTVHFTTSDAQGTLPADSTLTSGTKSFSATLKTAGTQSLTATDTVTPSIAGQQTGIQVNAAGAALFVVAGFPSPVTAGVAGSVTVTAKDAFNNTATGYAGTVHFTSSDGLAVLPANSTLIAGVKTFSGVTLETAGTQSLTATDTVTASITGAQTGIQVNPAAAQSLVVAGFPSPQTAGLAGGFTVTARDAFGNTATGYAGTVAFVSSDPQAVLPASSTLTSGTKSFSATLKTAGTQSLTATDTVAPSITGAQTGIQVNAAAAQSLTVAGFPSPATAGVAGSFTVTAKDQYGNTATSYAGTVHFTSSDAKAVLPANSTLTAGTRTFGATLETASPPTQSITATDTVTASITGAQVGIAVNAGPAASFVVSGLPASATAGTALTFTVTAMDGFGNVATGYTGTAHFTSNDAQAVLPANYTFTGGDAGVHAGFGVTFKTAGSDTVTATDTVTPSITGTSPPVSVTGGSSCPAISATLSTVTSVSSCLTVNTQALAGIEVDLKDTSGAAISGATVNLAVSATGYTFGNGQWVEAGAPKAVEGVTASGLGRYYLTLRAPTAATGTANIVVSATASLACGGGTVTLTPQASIATAPANADNTTALGGGVGGCPASNNLRVRVVQDENAANALSGALVMAGTAPNSSAFYASMADYVNGNGMTTANTATADGTGVAEFHDFDPAGPLSTPTVVTAVDAAGARAYFTLYKSDTADDVLPLPVDALPATTPYTYTEQTTGTVKVNGANFTPSGTCSDLQLGVTMPDQTIDWFGSYDLAALFGRNQCVNATGGAKALPGNFWIPQQSLATLCLGSIGEGKWTLSMGGTRDVGLPFGSVPYSTASGGDYGAILRDTTFSNFGGKTGVSGGATNVTLDIGDADARTLTVSFAAGFVRPGGTEATDLIAMTGGDMVNTTAPTGSGPLVFMGQKVLSFGTAVGNIAAPFSPLNVSAAGYTAANVGPFAAVNALYLPYTTANRNPPVSPGHANATSAKFLRTNAAGTGTPFTWGANATVTVGDMLDAPTAAPSGSNLTFTFSDAALNGIAPHYSRSVLSFVTTTAYNWLSCEAGARQDLSMRQPEWIFVRPYGVDAAACGAGNECFALPSLPGSWPRAAPPPNGQWMPGFTQRVGAGKSYANNSTCAGECNAALGEACLETDKTGGALVYTCGVASGSDVVTHGYDWQLAEYRHGLNAAFNVKSFAFGTRAAQVTHEATNRRAFTLCRNNTDCAAFAGTTCDATTLSCR